jgi:glycosyltransferase involved in cell wall biosynthesis
VIERILYALPKIDRKLPRAQSARGADPHAPERTPRRTAISANAWTSHDAQLILPSVISVVVPAHNEAAVIGRLLSGLVPDSVSNDADVTGGSTASQAARTGERLEPLETIVVANGCTDQTAQVAARHAAVHVISSPEPNKHRALRLGDSHAHGFPRLYVDADVELRAQDARALAKALEDPRVLAAAPARVTPLDGCPWTVRWYYQIWEQLPVVRQGLFGRGVIALSAEGHARISSLPELMGDDLAASLSFAPEERRVVETARVTVHPPRTLRDLLRRRVRSMTVTTQAATRTRLPGARTSSADLKALLREAPLRNGPPLAWFVLVTTVARTRARRAVNAGDFTTWLRDESSRAAARPDGLG